MYERQLKQDGIYELPNGREVIARFVQRRSLNLYLPDSWNSLGRAIYQVREDGQILQDGIPINLNIQQLRNTGRVAKRWRTGTVL